MTRYVFEKLKASLEDVKAWAAGDDSKAVLHSCNCIGPQNGNPVCPCAMRGVTVENGRYVQKIDLGPAPTASKAFDTEYSEFNRLMGRE